MNPPCIFIYANQGFTVRYLLRTQILKTLEKSGARVVILAHNPDASGFRETFESKNVIVEPFAREACERYLASSKLQRVIKLHRAFVVNGSYDTRTLDDFNRIWLGEQGWGPKDRWLGRFMGFVWNRLRWLLMRTRFLRTGLIWLESMLFTPRFHRALFEKYRPDLVVTTSPGWWYYDQYLLREARKEKVRTAAVILSWDNPSAMGGAAAPVDNIITWTEAMAQEMETLHDFPRESLFVGGVAHWDSYYYENGCLDREALFRQLGLDPSRKTLFFATKSPTRYPWAHERAKEIAHAIKMGRFKEPVQLLVRLHPIYFRRIDDGLMHQQLLQAFDDLEEKYPFVIINKPELHFEFGRSPTDFPEDETLLLASILRYSDVMVNMFSTMVVEASIFDLPAINLAVTEGFDSANDGRSRQDITIDYVQTHNQRIIQTGGVRNAFSIDELIDQVNAYLRDPSLDGEGRANIREFEAGPFKGNAGSQIAEHLLALAREN